MYKITLNYRTS